MGGGGAVENGFQNAPLALANPIYNVGLGVSPIVIGIAMALPRIWEIFLDPIIGIVSDRTKGRFGPRLPYLVVGILGSSITFCAMWLPPDWISREQMGVWLVTCALLFYTFFSLFAIPYAALTIEATKSGAERIGVMSARAFFSNASALTIYWLYWLCQRSEFANPVEGMRTIGSFFAFAIFLCGVLTIAVSWRSKSSSSLDCVSACSKVSTIKVLQIKPARYMFGALFSIMFGFTAVSNLGFYIFAFYVCMGDLKKAAFISAVKATLSTTIALCSCPLIGATAKRLGSDKTFSFLLLLGAASSFSMWFSLTPSLPYLSVISDIGIAVSLAGFWTLMPLKLGELCDTYQMQSGNKIQGVLSALYGVSLKMGASIALLATGYVIVICGFSSDMPITEMQPALLKMRIFYAVLPSLGIFFCLFFMVFFRRRLQSMKLGSSNVSV